MKLLQSIGDLCPKTCLDFFGPLNILFQPQIPLGEQVYKEVEPFLNPVSTIPSVEP